MPNYPSLNEWNLYVLMLGQALIGAISKNVRMVTLKFSESCWTIEAVLEEDCADDFDEMENVADDLLTYMDDIRDQISPATFKKITSLCITSKEALLVEHTRNSRVVFKRKET